MPVLRIVIVGGGPGGYEAALVAAEAGAQVTVVTAEPTLGGNSVLWDSVPSKTLIVSAEAMGWAQSAHRLGVRLESGEALAGQARVDLGAVMDRVRSLAGTQSADITAKVEAAGVAVVRGTARLAGRGAVEVEEDGGATRVLPADVVLIATGSNPRTLPFSVPDGERVFTSRELGNLRELPERLIVVGSGATGAEYAHAFARFGAEVHLISSRDQVLPNEDADAAAVIEGSFERWGMVIHRRTRAVDLERSADGVRLKVTRRATPDAEPQEEWVEGSHALFCIGQVPSSAKLGLEAAGVELAEGGAIPVDGVSRTNVPTIYAAGDVTGGIMLASVAAMQGRNAMWHALGQAVAPLRRHTIAACIFTDPEVASVGITEAQARERQLPFETVSLTYAGNPRAKMAENTDGFVKLHAMEGSGTVLGGVVVADRASDLITPVSVAVANGLSVAQLAHAFSIYPSMSGSLQETARQLMGRLASPWT
ncbi:MAG TPA: NAD(P)H-quinone dehydrogenase [Egibacteraceae bacterium]|nr:NAD(P)H-quinone dehydrogenase [Egibacteraceae bacterium]